MNIDKINELVQHSYYSSNYKPCVSLQDFEQYPVLDKSEARKVFLMSNGEIITRTSGSTGEFLNIKWNNEDYVRSLSLLWRVRKQFGISPRDVYCTNHALIHNTSKLLDIKTIINKNCISFSKINLSCENLEIFSKEILNNSPTWFFMQPSFVYALGIFLKNRNIVLPKSLKYIELTGEYLTQEIYNKICELYPSAIIKNMYGMQEFNGIAIGDFDELEILNKNVYVEVIDKNGKSVVYEEGDIVITGYLNKNMPLIRYRTGDKGIILKNGKLKITQSKSNDLLALGKQTFDGSAFMTLTEKINYYVNNNIIQFQYVLEGYNLQCFYVLQTSDIDQNELYNIVYEQIKKHFKYEFDNINIIITDSIIPQKHSHKVSYFVNKNLPIIN